MCGLRGRVRTYEVHSTTHKAYPNNELKYREANPKERTSKAEVNPNKLSHDLSSHSLTLSLSPSGSRAFSLYLLCLFNEQVRKNLSSLLRVKTEILWNFQFAIDDPVIGNSEPPELMCFNRWNWLTFFFDSRAIL